MKLQGGWPRLNSEKRIWVPHPYGFQGAVFVPGLLGCPTHRDTILSWESSSKTPIFLAELLCFVERESPSKLSSTISKAERHSKSFSRGSPLSRVKLLSPLSRKQSTFYSRVPKCAS